MKIKNELIYRCSLAIDFLRQTVEGNQFNLGNKKYSIANHLYTTSLFYSAAEIFQKTNLRETADELLQFVLDKQFSHNDISFIISEDQSLTVWNTMVAIILLKTGEINKSIEFANAAIEEIHDNKISTDHLDPGNQSSKMGKVLVLMMSLYIKTNDDKYLKSAKQVAQMIIKYPAIDSHNVWGLSLLNQVKPDKQYTHHIDSMIKEMQGLDHASMTSLLSAILQQCLIATGNPSEDLLRSQCERQIDLNNVCEKSAPYLGSFISSAWKQDTRIDYTTQSVFSFIQYLGHTSIRDII